jgi:hypothetical protein
VSFIYNLLYDIPLPSPGRSVRFWCLGDVAAISLPRAPQAGLPKFFAPQAQGFRNFSLRWKSQRRKIHMPANRFFNPYPRVWILFGNHKVVAKVSRLLVRGFFFFIFLKSKGWYGFSYGFLAVLKLLFHQCFILICTNIHRIKTGDCDSTADKIYRFSPKLCL